MIELKLAMSARDRLEMSLDELKATRNTSGAGGGGGDRGGGKGRRKGKGKGKGGGSVRNNGRESRRPQEYFDGAVRIVSNNCTKFLFTALNLCLRLYLRHVSNSVTSAVKRAIVHATAPRAVATSRVLLSMAK